MKEQNDYLMYIRNTHEFIGNVFQIEDYHSLNAISHDMRSVGTIGIFTIASLLSQEV